MPRSSMTIEFNEGFFDQVLNSSEVRAAVDLAAQRVVTEAKATAPVKTGAYRDSIHIEHEQAQHRQVAKVVADVDYGIYVEARTGNLARAVRTAKV